MDEARRIRGIEVKLARVRAGVRQYRVAQELGIAPTILCEWENERRPLSAAQATTVLAAIDRLTARGVCWDGSHGV